MQFVTSSLTLETIRRFEASLKMVKIQSGFPKLYFAVILLVFCVKCGDAELEQSRPFHLFDFESIFTKNIHKKFDFGNFTENDLECATELKAIGNALKKMDLWAIKSKLFTIF